MRAVLEKGIRTALSVVLALVLAVPAAAQETGVIVGSVTDTDGQPVPGARIVVDASSLGTFAGADGAFVIRGVPAGAHTVQVTHLGYAVRAVRDVAVEAGETVTLTLELDAAAIDLGGVVVSASRRVERITDAPATVVRVEAPEIELSVGNSFGGALKEIQGLDYIQVGATAVAVNARGFNSSFNNRMLMLTDNRVSVLPESGLPVGGFTTVPKVDLASVEVIIGPGAALYGADASNGVLSVRTRDPLEYPGTTLEMTAGALEKDGDEVGAYSNIQFRHAGVADGRFGYKVSGEYQRADDWSNELTYTNSSGAQFPELTTDFTNEIVRGEGALVYYGGLNRVQLSAGASRTDGVGQTNVGRNQFIGWTYNFVQFQASTPHWYLNAYRNQSQSGDSYALNRFSENRTLAAFDGMTDEEVMKESDWPSDGRLYAGEVQNNFSLGEIAGGEGNPLTDTEVVWGVQARRDVVSSDREWLTDRFEDDDVAIGTWGVYAQTRTPLHAMLDLVLAARYDDHDNYEAQFSPKAGVVFKPAPDHAVRLTYNRAFKSPTILQTNFWIPDFVPFVGVFGNTRGFEVQPAEGSAVVYEALVPEENTTWELGYRGLPVEKLYLDVTAYRAEYTHFFSPLTVIANPFAGDVVSFGDAVGPITNGEGTPQIVLTYFNLGEATIQGTDVGARYLFSDHLSGKATLSWLELDSRDAGTNPVGEEATALNAPSTKWTLGADLRDLSGFSGGATVRHVTGYDFQSGINSGRIPTFTTLDLTAAYEIERFDSQLVLNLNNLFGCRSEDPGLAGDDGACGFGVRHREMVNMPMIGTMIFLGIRYQR